MTSRIRPLAAAATLSVLFATAACAGAAHPTAARSKAAVAPSASPQSSAPRTSGGATTPPASIGNVFTQPLGAVAVAVTDAGLYVALQKKMGGPVTLARVDATTGRVEAEQRIGDTFKDAVVAGGHLWLITSTTAATLYRLDPQTLAIQRTWRVSKDANGEAGLALVGGNLWATGGGELVRVSATAGSPTAWITLPGADRSDLASDGTDLYVADTAESGTGVVQRRDPATGGVERTSKSMIGVIGPLVEAATPAGVWVSVPTGMMGYVQRLVPGTLAADNATSVHGSNGISVLAADGLVWVTDESGPAYCASPATGKKLANFALPNTDSDTMLTVGPQAIYYSDGQGRLHTQPLPAGCR